MPGGGEGDGVLLGDADVEETGWILPGERIEPGALAHGGGDGHDPGIFFGQPDKGVSEHPGIGDPTAGGREGFPRLDAEGADSVELERPGFGGSVTLAFPGHYMDQDGAGHLPDVLEVLDEMVQPVSLQRADIGKAQVFEESPGDDEALEGFFGLAGELHHLLADSRESPKEALHLGADLHARWPVIIRFM